MPNWCDNSLEVRGEPRDLEMFLSESFSRDKNDRRYLDFEKIIPLGEEGEDWIEKHCSGWGTKWNLDGGDFGMDHQGDYLSLWFLTAWTPPIPVMRKLTEKYPSLSFALEYHERGIGFRGAFEGYFGKVMRDECWDMTHDDLVELGLADEDDEEHD
jgi:hypothetical protein